MKSRVEHIGRIVSIVTMVVCAAAFVTSFVGAVTALSLIIAGSHPPFHLIFMSGACAGGIMGLAFAYTKKATE